MLDATGAVAILPEGWEAGGFTVGEQISVTLSFSGFLFTGP
jgi:hypothetical protein